MNPHPRPHLRLVVGSQTKPATAPAVHADATHMTLSGHIQRYLHDRRTRGEITDITVANQRSILNSFARSYGQRPVRNLARRDIERWMSSRSKCADGHSRSPGSRRTDFSIVHTFVTWMLRERIITRNPMIDIPPPKVPRSVPRSLTADEVRKVWAVLPNLRARAIVVLMYSLGLRKIEVHRLQVGDWDRTAGVLTVTGKAGHQRGLPVTPTEAHHLNAYLESIASVGGPMIRTGDGERALGVGHMGHLMADWMRAAGIKRAPRDGKGCHSWRHTAISDLADVEPDLRVLQEFAGHIHLSSTQVYLRRITLAKVRAAMDARTDNRRAARLRVA